MNWLKSDYLKFLCIVVIALIIFYWLYITLNKTNVNETRESFQNDSLMGLNSTMNSSLEEQYSDNMIKSAPYPSSSDNNEDFKKIDNTLQEQEQQNGNNLPTVNGYPKDQLMPSELLPMDSNSKWAQVNPTGQGDLKDQNFLNAGYHLGTNTVGQSLRNANLQLRSDPPNPQMSVSPWMQSTIEPDTNRLPFEIGK